MRKWSPGGETEALAEIERTRSAAADRLVTAYKRITGLWVDTTNLGPKGERYYRTYAAVVLVCLAASFIPAQAALPQLVAQAEGEMQAIPRTCKHHDDIGRVCRDLSLGIPARCGWC